MIMGIDEVGRGPWAGPLVVGAVVLPDGVSIDGLTDSKKLSAKKRLELDAQIREVALGWGLGWVHADELDAVGLSGALKLATIRAAEAVKAPYHEIIIDGTINFLKETNKGAYVTTLAKADLLIPAVSAASIIAKVARDTYMANQETVYPGYGFASHVGYGTAKHREALDKHGVTPLHRRSFAPIALLTGAHKRPSEPNRMPGIAPKTATSVGNDAETRVVMWLERNNHLILKRNWKTKWCEIDIITENDTTRYFVEVKYRSSTQYGGGVAAITPKKLNQMKFAAELFSSRHQTDKQIRLAVVSADTTGELALLEVE